MSVHVSTAHSCKVQRASFPADSNKKEANIKVPNLFRFYIFCLNIKVALNTMTWFSSTA